MAHRLRSVFAVSCTLRHVIKLEALAHRLIHARIVRYLPHLFWPVQLCKPSAHQRKPDGHLSDVTVNGVAHSGELAVLHAVGTRKEM
jgi:hypothetical protein